MTGTKNMNNFVIACKASELEQKLKELQVKKVIKAQQRAIANLYNFITKK